MICKHHPSLFSHWQKFVSANECLPPWSSVIFGVPKGTVLKPPFFCMYDLLTYILCSCVYCPFNHRNRVQLLQSDVCFKVKKMVLFSLHQRNSQPSSITLLVGLTKSHGYWFATSPLISLAWWLPASLLLTSAHHFLFRLKVTRVACTTAFCFTLLYQTRLSIEGIICWGTHPFNKSAEVMVVE